MKNIGSVSKLAIVLLLCAGYAAPQAPTNSYTQLNLASDIAGMAQTLDPHMVNPWGLSRTGGSRQGGPWFVSDYGSGIVSLVSGYVGYQGTYYTVPPASGQGTGTPAGGCVFNQTNTITTLDGTVQQHLTGLNAMNIIVNNSAQGAVYTACTEWHSASSSGPHTLYLANSAGAVEAYDEFLNPVALAPGAFVDPSIPAGFAPYGLYTSGTQVPNGKIWVSFFNGAPGAGQGYVDAFDQNGNLLLSLQHGSWMNQPSGITQAPSGFGTFSNDLLVAMAGNGMIAAFNPSTGKLRGFLKNSSGQYIVNPGIRGLGFGSGSYSGGPTTTLFFTAGTDGFAHGLFGSITAN